jgi:segregation and condensation protein B
VPKPIDVVEALLFASDAPLEAERIREVLDLENVAAARALVGELVARYEAEDRGLAIMEVGGGWRMVTRPELAPWLVRLARARTRVRLSRPALETLAIVAYKQPISRGQMSAIRGVNVEATLNTLLQRGYVQEVGRDPGPGAAVLYGTTREFLERLGVPSLDALPPLGDFVPDASVVEALERGLRINDDPTAAPIDEPVPETSDGDAAQPVD